MKDLISREAVIERIKYEADVCNSGITRGVLELLQTVVEGMPPAVDAVEVVHGRWIEHHNYFQGFYKSTDYKCSVCGLERDWLGGANYCPNCGARMDGE